MEIMVGFLALMPGPCHQLCGGPGSGALSASLSGWSPVGAPAGPCTYPCSNPFDTIGGLCKAIMVWIPSDFGGSVYQTRLGNKEVGSIRTPLL